MKNWDSRTGQASIKCDLEVSNDTTQNPESWFSVIDLSQGFSMKPNGCNYYFNKQISVADKLILNGQTCSGLRANGTDHIFSRWKTKNGSSWMEDISLAFVSVVYSDIVGGFWLKSS